MTATPAALLLAHGVASTAGDLLPLLQLRGLVASKEHLAAANHIAAAAAAAAAAAGAAGSNGAAGVGAGARAAASTMTIIGLHDCYAVRLVAVDSERLKMPVDSSIGLEASLDQLWRWGIRQLRVVKAVRACRGGF